MTAAGGSAIGAASSVTTAYGTALGYGSIANRAGLNGANEAFSGTAVNSPYGALSIGQPGFERQITNVAGGTQDTDAVNIRQLRAAGNSLAGSLGGGAGFDPNTNAYTAPTYTVGGVPYNTVAGALTAANNLGVQYTPDANGNPTNVVDLTKGGTLNPVSVTGLAPATTGSGAVSLSQLPLQYSTAGAPTTANPATPSNDVTLVGTNGAPVKLHNVAPGVLSAASTDAVNGTQLFTTNQNEANDATNIAGLTNGTLGLVQQNQATRNITVGANTDGALVDFTNNAGAARTLTGVAPGQIAIGSTQAVNGSQLYGAAASIAQDFGGGSTVNPNGTVSAPTYTVGGVPYNNVAGALAASNNLGVQYTPDANGNPTNVVDLTKGGTLNPVSVTGLAPATTGSGAVSLSQLPLQYSTAGAPTTANPATPSNDVTLVGTNGAPVVLHNVAPGALSAASTDAVNGAQLFATNQNETNDATNITGLRGSLDNGTIGLVQQDPTTRNINVAANTDGALVDFTNNAGAARTLNGVAAGTLSGTSTQAVNGSQLYATNQAETTDAANIANLSGGITNGTLGLVQQNQTTRNLTVGANTDGTDIDLTNNAGAARTLSGVAAGTLSATSTQAVNGSQLYATNQAVAGLTNGSLGLVQQDPTTRDLTVGANTDGTNVDFANNAGVARTLNGVAAGQIASGSTQAVNGGQVYGIANSVAQNLGGGSIVNPDGTVSAPTYTVQGNTYSNVGSALGGLDTAVSDINAHGSKYFAVNTTGAAASAIGTDTVAIGPAASAIADGGVALGANSVASRAGLNGATESFSDTSVASTAGAVSVGAAGAERQITNVAGGTAPTDAVNVRQLTAVGSQVATVLGGGAALAPDGTLIAPTYTVQGSNYSSVGTALNALDSSTVKYDVNPATGGRANSITLQGGDPNQPVLISNVATGQRATDAANTGQVAAAQTAAYAYTDKSIAGVETQIGGLQTQINQTRTEARQGAAIGLAAGALRYDDRPGKISTSVGAGVWKGEAATAMGLGYTLPNGLARVNANAVTTGRDFGVAAGASFTFN